MYGKNIYTFKSGKSLFIVPCWGDEDEAWNELAKRLSCRLELAKQRSVLLSTNLLTEEIIKIKL